MNDRITTWMRRNPGYTLWVGYGCGLFCGVCWTIVALA